MRGSQDRNFRDEVVLWGYMQPAWLLSAKSGGTSLALTENRSV